MERVSGLPALYGAGSGATNSAATKCDAGTTGCSARPTKPGPPRERRPGLWLRRGVGRQTAPARGGSLCAALMEVAIAMANVLLSLLAALPAAVAIPESFARWRRRRPPHRPMPAPARVRLGADASTPRSRSGPAIPRSCAPRSCSIGPGSRRARSTAASAPTCVAPWPRSRKRAACGERPPGRCHLAALRADGAPLFADHTSSPPPRPPVRIAAVRPASPSAAGSIARLRVGCSEAIAEQLPHERDAAEQLNPAGVFVAGDQPRRRRRRRHASPRPRAAPSRSRSTSRHRSFRARRRAKPLATFPISIGGRAIPCRSAG